MTIKLEYDIQHHYKLPIFWTPPHAFSGIVVGQSEAGFICEQYPAPLLPCPALLKSAPCSMSLMMGWGQWQADNRSLDQRPNSCRRFLTVCRLMLKLAVLLNSCLSLVVLVVL